MSVSELAICIVVGKIASLSKFLGATFACTCKRPFSGSCLNFSDICRPLFAVSASIALTVLSFRKSLISSLGKKLIRQALMLFLELIPCWTRQHLRELTRIGISNPLGSQFSTCYWWEQSFGADVLCSYEGSNSHRRTNDDNHRSVNCEHADNRVCMDFALCAGFSLWQASSQFNDGEFLCFDCSIRMYHVDLTVIYFWGCDSYTQKEITSICMGKSMWPWSTLHSRQYYVLADGSTFSYSKMEAS